MSAINEIAEFAKKLSLSPADTDYVRGLYLQFGSKSLPQPLKIGDNFIPTALMNEDDWTKYPEIDYGTKIYHKDEYAAAAKKVVLLAQSMDGGLGSSLGDLKEYLSTITEGRRALSGAKSSDLFKKVELDGFDAQGRVIKIVTAVSVLEFKVLQILSREKYFQRIDLQELESEQSREFIEKFFDTEIYLKDRLDQRPGASKRTYRQYFKEIKKTATLKEPLIQALLPTIDIATKRLTDRFKAPGSHGYWGTTAIHEIINENLSQDGTKQLRALYNGDGQNNFIDHYMAGFMVQEGVGFVMLTSTRMPIDAKGGILGLQKESNGKWRPGMMELADAKNVGQVSEFQAVGLTKGNKGKQRFNTNLVILNDSLLQPFLRELQSFLGEARFNEIIAPNLISNPDKEKGINKLEGALGHVFLNLNAWIMTDQSLDGIKARELLSKYHISKLFATINLESDQRTKFFTPNKAPSDQEYYNSDRFDVLESGELINKGPDQQPGFELDPNIYGKAGKYINSYNTFKGASFREFTGMLSIKGQVNLSNVIFRGEAHINIINDTLEVHNLNNYASQLALQGITVEGVDIVLSHHCTIKITKDGVFVTKL